MSKVHQRGAVTPSMNITPLIDVVFLLIVFFMLVNNIVSEEKVPMIPPDIDESQARQLGEVDRVVVSVAPEEFRQSERAEDPLDHPGMASYVKVGALKRFEMDQMAEVAELLGQARADNPEVEVLLRADSALYYGQVQPVMAAITAAGISKVNLVAYLPEELR